MASYEKFNQIGIALDPIHVGTGGARIGRVDLTIVRDLATQVPKIPGSSLAGVYRTYVAMHFEVQRPSQFSGRKTPFYPNCVGLGLDDQRGHCRGHDCPVCTVFGFARGAGQAGGFAGLAAFSDAHVLLFPVPTRQGPHWITCPNALRLSGLEVSGVTEDAVYMEQAQSTTLNLGWLLMPVKGCSKWQDIQTYLSKYKIQDYIRERIALVPDRLFAHIVNSNLEVRTSVAINSETGAAEDGALFSYEALPRGTVLYWEIITKTPQHFRVAGNEITATIDGKQRIDIPEDVHRVTQKAHPYLEYLGIGGMGTRGMGRVRVLYAAKATDASSVNCGSDEDVSPKAPTESSLKGKNEEGKSHD